MNSTPKHEPFWRETSQLPSFSPLDKDISVDVAIVGGGITGITAAYLLSQEGLTVALLEANDLLNGTTGHTTAKVTSQHDLFYDELIQHHGAEQAKAYYEANQQALHFIQDTIQTMDIQCDYSEEDAYIYATTDKYAKKIEAEMKAYEKLGITGSLTESIPFDIPIKAALKMDNQGQFHPINYLKKLVEETTKNGGKVYEQTVAVDIEKGDRPNVVTRSGAKVSCSHVLICSHFPFYEGTGLYSARMYAERSYIIGVKTKNPYPGGMYISAEDPTRSLRSTPMNGEPLVLVGGDSHKSGHGKAMSEHYKALETFAEQIFDIDKIVYHWSAQDLFTLDKVPYIGPITSRQTNILIATGYKKWGMTLGTTAAIMLKNEVLKKDSPYSELFTPSRFSADPSMKNFIKQNTLVAGHFIKGKLERAEKHIEEVAKDEGAVVMVNGQRTGAYRDKNGELHLVDTTCTHLGCEVEWNDAERSWDCPCHGSRFSVTGDVLEGPAVEPLPRRNKE
ncbi:FAD-dependent oxidoreductase [Bacillus tianshenii]|nr:FAD-dependent oxidoreductase [Bacillus tianshenii]